VRRRVAIAGATGLVGKALVAALAPAHDVIALGRGAPSASPDPAITFRRCDLYDAEQAVSALEGATHAVYLVHSMMPSAALVQASFSDLDVICADKFARAAAKAGASHIVYLGGLTPEHTDALSEPGMVIGG
jgi:nucleoside-diphosphate-sugar epimerase